MLVKYCGKEQSFREIWATLWNEKYHQDCVSFLTSFSGPDAQKRPTILQLAFRPKSSCLIRPESLFGKLQPGCHGASSQDYFQFWPISHKIWIDAALQRELLKLFVFVYFSSRISFGWWWSPPCSVLSSRFIFYTPQTFLFISLVHEGHGTF